MTRASDPIIVHVAGQDHSFDSVADLLARTSSFAKTTRQEWQDRKPDLSIEKALASLARRSEIIATLAEAGLHRLEKERADAEAALAEIERLVGDL